MKVLSLTQPWATLIALGAKQIETRSWTSPYRGPIAIHAAKRFPSDAQRLCNTPPFRAMLGSYGLTQPFPTGAIIAVAVLRHVGRIYERPGVGPMLSAWPEPVSLQELHFGNYEDGRYGWVLEKVAPLPSPIPAKGALNLWDWTPPEALRSLLATYGVRS